MSKYWETRKDLLYYKLVLELAKKYCPSGGSLLDVGGGQQCEYLTWFDWFQSREIVDIEGVKPIDGIKITKADFMNFEVEKKYDLVLCMQVLEHLEDPRPFCRKLLKSGSTVIISVPYKWKKGWCKFHLQDPVDEMKLAGWAGKPAKEAAIARDRGVERLVAVYQ